MGRRTLLPRARGPLLRRVLLSEVLGPPRSRSPHQGGPHRPPAPPTSAPPAGPEVGDAATGADGPAAGPPALPPTED